MPNIELVLDLVRQSGCGMMECKKAVEYAETHAGCTPIGFLKAIGIAVATPNMTFEERVRHFSREDDPKET